MALELTGKVFAVLPSQGGVSQKGNKWVRYSFVIETNDQYPKKVLFTCTDEEKWKTWNIQAGMNAQVSFNVSAREWNGKWFTDVEAWRVVSVDGGATNGNAQAQAPQPQGNQVVYKKEKPEPEPQPSNDNDEMPF